MCWPSADKPYQEFSAAMAEFESKLNDILIYDMPIKQKYVEIHTSETGSRKLTVYCQRGTDLLVKIIINNDIGLAQYGKDAVLVHAEDANIVSKITGLDSYKIMQEKMAEVREIIYADQVAVKLTYGF
jgi:hypothetical protein